MTYLASGIIRSLRRIFPVLLLSVLLVACNKMSSPPIEEILIGRWSITEVNYKAGPFRPDEDLSEAFQHFDHTFTSDGAVLFENTMTGGSRRGKWSLIKIPQNIGGPGQNPIWYTYEYIYLNWDSGAQQEWLLGVYGSDHFYATEPKGNGSYIYKLERK